MVSATRVPKHMSDLIEGQWLHRNVPRLGSIDHTICLLSCKFWHRLICGRPRPRKTFPQFYDQIACVHMSGLLMRSHMNAGQDGFRDKGSKTYERPHRRPVASSECPTSWIDRSHHLLIILQV